MSSKLRKRIKSLNGLFFHEHENKKARHSLGIDCLLHRQVTADKILGRFDS